MNRRDFLAGASLLAAAPILTRVNARAATPLALSATTRTIDVNGRAATVLGLLQADGTQGIRLGSAEDFNVRLTNALKDETLIHWHGQIPPNALDGVPNTPAPLMQPGEVRDYLYKTVPGTHWMHAHTLQEQSLLAAPLIVRTKEEEAEDAEEIVVLLHDFSWKTPEEILAGLNGGPVKPMDHSHMNHGAGGGMTMPMGNMANMSGMMGQMSGGMAGMDHSKMGHGMSAMPGMNHGMDHGAGGMDLNDIAYDAFLANDRTLADPAVYRLEKRARARLRIINGATSTAFHINTGSLQATLVAVDGQPVMPITSNRFPMTMGQRIDLMVEVKGRAFPILAEVEGTTKRTGFILAAAGATVAKIADDGDKPVAPVGLDLETRLQAATPLASRKADKSFVVTLGGTMQPYQWTMAGAEAIKAQPGERLEITLRNMSMMAHPMHTHGHHFQVIGIGGKAMSGARRDVVLVPTMGEVKIALDAGTSGKWAFHCHHLYHMASGMMAFIEVG